MTFAPGRILVLILAATAATAVLTGCTADDSGSQRPATPAVSAVPSVQLADAARHLQQTSFAMKLTIGLSQGTGTLTGKVDPVKKAGAFTSTTSGRGDDRTITEWRMIGTTLYAKSTTNGVATNAKRPWRRLKSEPTDGLAKSFDAASMAQALTKATAVQRTDGTHFTGTLDGATASSAFGLRAPTTSAQIGASTPAPTSVAFTADIDDRHRLIGYRATLTSSTGDSRNASIVFSDFGTTVTVQPPPPGQIVGSTIG
ncbi:hypothetical protein DMB66_13930 [Actinoplanes sp. ATCC 53533]|uniref:hypothetical protein n=1 Tax=Actinoplanes sp. ATCC 53533 TaxID=1288362 RepID=UPI000F76833A|nr:hypothetical protein [Actinoplanes sp. ATCC 53533]RSM68166.1 hypothetical protein DMB66_13930 [Actinoplanes sp. ATCC 53533]